MTVLHIALSDRLLTARGSDPADAWETHTHLEGEPLQAVAVDPARPQRVYCATFGRRLRRSDDGGESWRAAGPGIDRARVTAVAVSTAKPFEGGEPRTTAREAAAAADAAHASGKSHASGGAHVSGGAIYAGTEPSAVYRSADGGDSWDPLPGLDALPSAPTWSFPPRPETHHVRAILADPTRAGRIYVCIEAGALARTDDDGRTWRDRVPGGPIDTHTLAAHPGAPGRLYAAAGDGYFESDDGGESWRRPRAGLRHHYLWGVAVDADDPDTVLVTAARGARRAHDATTAESRLYRRDGGTDWTPVATGLPDPDGTTAGSLAVHPSRGGEFYLATNHGVFRSTDAGLRWQRLPLSWPDAARRQRVKGIAIARHG